MKKLIAVLPLFILSCNDKKIETPKTETKITTTISEAKEPAPKPAAEKTLTPLFGDSEVEALPLDFKINFDNFENKQHPISAEKVKEMNLAKIAPDGAKFYYQYRVESPANYDLAVIVAETDEELFANIVSFDKDHKMIDDAPVSYDEIAESSIQKTAKVEKDKVTVTTMDYSKTEDGEKSVQIFKITPEGKFVEQK